MDGVQHAQAGALTGIRSCTDDDQSPRIDQGGAPHLDAMPAGDAR